jgi:hypothetical protein
MTMRRCLLAWAAATVALSATGTAHAAPAEDVATVRSATAAFHSTAAVEQHGYALLVDTQKIACIDMPGRGGMGVHWANPALVADKRIEVGSPEALVYAAGPDGTLNLAAVEYVVVQADWDGAHPAPPTLFGQPFSVTTAPNRYGLPAFYSLHAWVWKHNPAGQFAMWNPDVTCPAPSAPAAPPATVAPAASPVIAPCGRRTPC